MFYNLANSQGIQLVVPPPATTTPIPTLARISVVRASTFAPKVDQLVDAATTLIMDELSPSPLSTKRIRDEDQ